MMKKVSITKTRVRHPFLVPEGYFMVLYPKIRQKTLDTLSNPDAEIK